MKESTFYVLASPGKDGRLLQSNAALDARGEWKWTDDPKYAWVYDDLATVARVVNIVALEVWDARGDAEVFPLVIVAIETKTMQRTL